ncbi:MAG: radical SAM protein [Caldilineaceae bacterium]|nr:radical SAM protein [Caldilineaceae bacterium]
MQYVYGPIPSRRLGRSLGVDPIPLKTCNWNCVYCQLGRSMPLTNQRQEYVPREAILQEIAAALAHHGPGEIDFISFVGSGEPTLHSGLGWLIRAVKDTTEIPVAVITNGALLYRPEVRGDLLPANVVMPTVSAGSPAIYKRIHRPHPDTTFDRLIDGLCHFRNEYSGQLWIEVMLMRDLNDTELALRDLASVLERIAPDQVHIVVPERPPAEPWVKPPDEEGLLRAAALLGPIARVVHPYVDAVDVFGYATAEEAVLSIVTRHPMSLRQLEQVLARWPAEQILAAVATLRRSDQLHVVDRLGTRFYTAAPSFFPNGTSPEK